MMGLLERTMAALTIARHQHLTCRELLAILVIIDWIMFRWSDLSDMLVSSLQFLAYAKQSLIIFVL